MSPRSKTSRTFPLRNLFIPGRSIEACGAFCIGKGSTLNAQLSMPNSQSSSLDVGRSPRRKRCEGGLDGGRLLFLYGRNRHQTTRPNFARPRLGFFERSPEGFWETE